MSPPILARMRGEPSTRHDLNILDVEVRDQVTERVIVVAGEVDAANADQLMKAVWDEEMVAPVTVVDLSNCHFMDSAGVRALTQGLRRSKAAGLDVRLLVASSGSVRRVLELCAISDQFPIVWIDPP